jgi:hypothetical protein
MKRLENGQLVQVGFGLQGVACGTFRLGGAAVQAHLGLKQDELLCTGLAQAGDPKAE